MRIWLFYEISVWVKYLKFIRINVNSSSLMLYFKHRQVDQKLPWIAKARYVLSIWSRRPGCQWSQNFQWVAKKRKQIEESESKVVRSIGKTKNEQRCHSHVDIPSLLIGLDYGKNEVKFRFKYENPRNQTAGWNVDEHFWKKTDSDGDIRFYPKMIHQDGGTFILGGDFSFATIIYEIKNQRGKYFRYLFQPFWFH